MAPHEQLTAALKAHGSKTDGTNWQCPVPGHGSGKGDKRPSLKVDAEHGPDGERVLVYCHAGCTTEQVVEALGLRMKDLFTTNGNGASAPLPAAPEGVVEYVYTDAAGDPLYRVTRKQISADRKTFSQARYSPDDPTADAEGYIARPGCMTGCERVLYRLPQVLAAKDEGRTVFVVEGEKDADALTARGHAATCNPQGAGKWKSVRDHAREVLSGVPVVVVQDKDENGVGQRHAREVVDSLQDVAASVRLVEAREGSDVSDHLDAGLDVDALVEVAGPDVEPSRLAWELVDVFADHGDPPPRPDLMKGADGTALMYRGQRIILSGEPSGGKTWCATALVMEAVKAGEKCAWIDADRMGGPALAERLRLLGMTEDEGSRLFRYSPARDPLSREELQEQADGLVRQGFSLVVLDSWGPALGLAGMDVNAEGDVNAWHHAWGDVLHDAGITCLQLDHVSKSHERNRRFPVGSHAKLRGVEMHYTVEPVKDRPLTRRSDGAFLLTCQRDRLGHVAEGQRFEVTFTHTDNGMTWDVAGGERQGTFAHTQIMEKVSRHLELAGEQSLTQIRASKPGKAERVPDALHVLELGGWVTKRTGNARGAQIYKSVTPFHHGDELPDGYFTD